VAGGPHVHREFSVTEEIVAGDITVKIPNAGKVLFPDDGITKEDLARYYADAAGRMLPWLRDRPVTMMRYPDGLTGQRIVQKNVPAYFPDWIRRVEVPKEGGVVHQAVCGQPADLVYLASQACIEVHAFTSRADKLDAPDQMVFDFDPPDNKHVEEVRNAALWARELLDDELGLTSYVRTTGGRGLHVHVPLDRRAGFDPVLEFTHRVAAVLAGRHPDVITTEQRKDKRGERVYADVQRNAYAQLVVAPYGVRARPGAPVSTPLNWSEVRDADLEPGQFTISTIRARLERADDPWAGFTQAAHGLARASERLAELSRD
jgi:bifunctional non-homologous end joining protein LigD